MAAFGLGKKILIAGLGSLATGGVAVVAALDNSVKAASIDLHAPKYPWGHNGHLDIYDHASLRRGYEVYKNVCMACHSIEYVQFNMLVGVTHTEEEAKVEAADFQIEDGPNDKGEMFKRPGILSDKFPKPYPNDEAARVANNGALPPDLSLIALGRHDGQNYIFSLLTGYCDPPAGIHVREGLYYNPYFPGGAIGMPPPLYNEIIEYGDGTPATLSQLAKDVTTFLAWTANPTHDERKKTGLKVMSVLAFMIPAAWYMKRFKFSVIKTRKWVFKAK